MSELEKSQNIGTTTSWVSLALKVSHAEGSATVMATVNEQPVDGIIFYDQSTNLPPDMALAQAFIHLSGCMPDTVDCQHYGREGEVVVGEEIETETD